MESSKQMVAIPIREFVSGTKIPVDLYLKLSDSKYILLVKKGDTLQFDRALKYENKNVENLYCSKEDYAHYISQSVAIAGIVVSRADFDNRVKAEVVTNAMTNVFSDLENVGFSENSLANAKTVLKSTMDLLESKPILNDLLEALNSMGDGLLAHSLAVAVVATAIGEAMGFTQTATLEKLGLGGLFHDIGMRQLPKDILNKPCAQLSYEEVQLLESHPQRGAQMLRSVGFIPEDVISIVFEHQENMAGQGYPRRLKHVRIHPLARIVSLADAYCDLILKNVNCPIPMNATDAYFHIEQNWAPLFSREAMKALRVFVKDHEVDVKAG